ncbi:MAG: YqgE/AlgH family protein [Chitinophagales bacterium]|nr:YqgE/AlgH family protein [Bacteroidota bacterium]
MQEVNPVTGCLLLSEPFSYDVNFHRTVVLLCEHREDGTFGLILNRRSNLMLNEVVDEVYVENVPVFVGGPVQQNTMHILHTLGDKIPDSAEVSDGLFWGGDFTTIIQLLNAGELDNHNVRFYIGYSGWSEGQLAEEMKERTWIVAPHNTQQLFETETPKLWHDILYRMGGDYRILANAPAYPQLN